MTEHLFSKCGELISDKGMRERQAKYFIEHLHQIKSASPIYTNVRGEVVSAEDRDATMSVADFKPETDVEHMSIDNCIGVSGIFLTSQIVGVSGEEAEKICVKIYRYIDEVYDDYSPCMECRFPSFAMAILYGDSLGKFIRYSEPILTSDCKAIKLHQLICLKLKNRLNNMFLDLEIPAEERICGDDGVLGLCRIPGIYCSEAGRYATIFGTHNRTYPIKALCRYLDVDLDLSEAQIDSLIRKEKEEPEYITGLFKVSRSKETDLESEKEEIESNKTECVEEAETEASFDKNQNQEAREDELLVDVAVDKPERDFLKGRIKQLQALMKRRKNLDDVWYKLHFILLTAYVRLYGVLKAEKKMRSEIDHLKKKLSPDMYQYAIGELELRISQYMVSHGVTYYALKNYGELHCIVTFPDGTEIPVNEEGNHWRNEHIIELLQITPEEQKAIGINRSIEEKKAREESKQGKIDEYREIAYLHIVEGLGRRKIATKMGLKEEKVKYALKLIKIRNSDKKFEEIDFEHLLYQRKGRLNDRIDELDGINSRTIELKNASSPTRTSVCGVKIHCIDQQEQSTGGRGPREIGLADLCKTKDTAQYDDTAKHGDSAKRDDAVKQGGTIIHDDTAEPGDADKYDDAIKHGDTAQNNDMAEYGDTGNQDDTKNNDVAAKVKEAYGNKAKRLLILGRSGSGKSYLLSDLCSKAKRVLILAPTGKAAEIHPHGKTIHKAFHLPVCALTRNMMQELPVWLLKDVDVLFLDEIGMLRVDLFLYIYTLVEKAEKQYDKTIQVAGFGDFSQLPPVMTSKDREVLKKDFPVLKKGFAFECDEWSTWFGSDNVYVLDTCYRQGTDSELVSVSDRLAVGDKSVADWYNANIGHDPIPQAIYIAALNKTVDQINQRETEKLLSSGVEKRLYRLQDDYDTPLYDQELAVGMPIICTRNMSKIKNGTYARIIRLNAKSIRVIKNTGEKVTIKMDKEHGLPVCIGYAITVHRSQGVTLDEVNVIADGMFECGQLYVALTRCKSREGMRIIGKIKPEHICANEEAIAWMSETIQNKEPER